jgi:cytochrome c peroxidase
MKKLLIFLSLSVVICNLTFTACIKKPTEFLQQDGQLNLPNTAYSYFENGAGYGGLDAQATLGRVLFYDKHLSKNNAISCASCHIQEHAFGDNKALSQGFENKRTSRNSIAIHNIDDNSFSPQTFGREAPLF